MPPVPKAGIARAPPALPAPGGGRSGAVGAAPAWRLLLRLRPGRGAGARRRGGVPLAPGQWQQRFTGVLPSSPPPASQVLQGGGLESPTKPKGRPKKNSIPSSEQLSEQERARDAEKPPEGLGSPAEVSQEE